MPPPMWHRFAVGNVIYFRRMTLPYRMTPYFGKLFAHLRKNREFRWFWEQVFYEEKLYFVGRIVSDGVSLGGAFPLSYRAFGDAYAVWQPGDSNAHTTR